MWNRKTLVALAALAAGTLVVPVVLAGDEPKVNENGVAVGKDGAPYVIGKTVGTDIPDLSLSLVLNDDGRSTVADYKGEVVIVDLWSTTCGPCRGLIPTFSKHQDEMGKKGLQIFGITGENKDVLLRFLSQSNTATVSYKMASGSSGGLLSPGTVPYCFVVDVDSKVVWQGHGAPPSKLVEAEMKRVKPATAEDLQARAQKAVDRANAMAGERRVLAATELLEKVEKNNVGTEAAKAATARLKEIREGAETSVELAAQKTLAKILGGTEIPAEKLSKKDRLAKVVQLEAFVKKDAANAPGAQEQAEAWLALLGTDAKTDVK